MYFEKIDWEPILEDLGFGSLKEMFKTLYNQPKTNSLNKMAKYLGISTATCIKYMEKNGIERRAPSTHPPKRKGHYYYITNKLLAKRNILKDLTVRQIVERFGLKDANQFYCLARWHKLEYKKKRRGN